MRTWGNGIVGKAIAAVGVAAVVIIGQPLMASAAPGPLTITPLGWNVVGLDSNDETDGPNVFPVGGRVCNTGSDPVTNVGVNWSWLSSNTYINLTNTTSFSTASLAAGACRDYYFNVEVTRDNAAYGASREFQITATGDAVAAVSTPTDREIYVESLVSQNRNAVNDMLLVDDPGAGCYRTTPGAPANAPETGTVNVGSTCTVQIEAKTATGGYEQLVTAFYFNNSLFQIESFEALYDVPSGYTNDQMYADACGWANDISDPDYLSCLDTDPIAGGKAGGNPMVLTITFTVLGVGGQAVSGMIYDYSGSSFHYNDDGGSEPNLLTLTAEYGPTAPDAVDDSATTDEDTFVDVDVLANDSDVNGNLDPSSLSVDTQPANGTASVVGGQIRYTPDPDFFGTDSFTYEICDSTAPTPLCSTATVDVTVNSVNDPPVAVDDSDTVDEDSSVTVDVLGNDTDVDDGLDPLSVNVTSGPSNGSTSVNPDGSIDYTPDPDFFGSDSFVYEVCDLAGDCDTATVDITVSSINDGPTAVDDSDTTDEDTTVTVDVLGNDSDPDDGLDPSSVTVTFGPSNGSVSVNPDGSIDYTPDPDYFGTDSFIYEVCDLSGACDAASVDLTVNSVNDPPVAVDDSDTVDEDSSVSVDVLGNDTDVDDGLDPLSVNVTSGPSNGSTSVNPDGSIDYTPDPDFFGSDSFTYEVCDLAGACDTATVDITVNSVNDGPDAVDDSDTTDEDTTVTVDVLGNDSDVDDGLDPSSVTVTFGPGNGSTSVNPDGTIDYTPDPDFFGTDSFIYEVCDLAGDCDAATVDITVNAVNDPPVAVDDSDTVDEDSSVTVDVLGNDSDVDDGLDPASVTVTSGPSNGSTSVNPDGSIDYTPDPDFFGSDSFTYEVCDLAGDCDTATVDITVNDVNEPPTAANDMDSVNEDSSVTVDVLGNDSDSDDGLDPASVSVTGGPSNGSASVNPDGSIDYTPDPDFFGTDSFIYEVCDLAGACDTATVDITVNSVNDGPTAVDDSDTTDEDTAVTVDVLGNDSDVDDGLDPASVTVTSGPSNGSTSVNPDGSIDYTPDPDFFGFDSFTYEVCDLSGACDTAIVDITVDPVNDPPTAQDDFANVDQDTPTDIDVQANDGDVDGDALTTVITSLPSDGSVVVNPDGTVEYTPDLGFIGNDSFTYDVCDPSLSCASATVFITVSDLPEPPDAVDDVDVVDEDSSVTVDVLGNDTDPEGDIDPASVTVTGGPSNGSTSVNPDGSIDYTPDADFFGSDSFTYEVCDTTPIPVGPQCDTATVDITVNAVNDGPNAVDDADTVDEDSSVTVDVLGNDTDVDDGLDPASVNVTGGPSNGSTSVNPDGSIDYTPDVDFSGTDSFTYEVCDLAGLCDTATVDITVNEVNDGPTADNDSDTVDEDSSVTVDVLGNDSDPDDGLDPSSVTVTGAPSNGSTTVNPDGSVDYTPDPDFFGSDSFTYEVCDLAGLCDTATVDITVNSVNDGPDAVDDAALVDEDDTVTIDVLANDTDVEGAIDPSTVNVTSGPSNGSTSVNPDGSIDYTPDPDFFGTDSFTYEVCDVDGDCDTATVDVTVSAINDGPDAVDDSDTTDEDTAVTVDVLGNDTDIDDGLDPASVTVTSGPSDGSTSVNPDGSIDYTPDAGFSGSDSFTYEVCDFTGACDTATVDITVNDVNDPPVALDDSAAGVWGADIDVDVLANDSDPDGTLDDTSVTVTSGPSNGSATVNPDGSITYVADDGFVGVDTFDYEVCDDGTPTECDTATVGVTVSANQGPDAVDDTATVDEDAGPVTIDVLGNDSDPEGGALTTTSAGPAANGTVTVNPDGTVDYDPDPDFSGTDTFTYTVCDVAGNCSTATVVVTVNEVNDPPNARDDADSVREGRTVTVDVLGNDTDSDNVLDPATVTITNGPAHGSVSVNPDGSIDFTADAGYDGADSFEYEVCDDGAPPECDTATVDMDIWLLDPNRRPAAVNDSATTPEDTPVTIDVRGNDSDPDGDPLSIDSFSQPRHGVVTRSGGQLVFTPDANWHGTTSFTYVVCDPDGRCDDARVTVTVDPVDDAPIANDDAIEVRNGKPVNIPVVDNDDEVDGEPVTVAIVDQPAHGTVTVKPDGTVVYTPNEGYDGPDEFTYELCDPDGDCSEATVTVDVNGSTAPPAEPREPEPDPEPQPGVLPHTGGDVTRLALWGTTLLLMGIALVGRRRIGLR